MDTDHDKIIRTEEKLTSISGVVYEIRDNHLAHLKANIDDINNKVDSLNIKLSMWSGGIIVAIWVMDKFFK